MDPILHERLPVAPWMAEHTLRLPGTTPIAPSDWLQRDEVFAAQMAYRDRLIAERPAAVHALLPGGEAGAAELRDAVVSTVECVPGYARLPGRMRRPDGIEVPLDGPPLIVAGRLVQEDLCLLEKPAGAEEHVLTGAILCFPSNWTLGQKLGRGLSRIHVPVEPYDGDIARRVQRLFDLVRPEAPLMRANLLLHEAHDLHNPRREFEGHAAEPGTARFVRVERQVILRLPVTRTVAFSIHTYMVPAEALTEAQRAKLAEMRPGVFAAV